MRVGSMAQLRSVTGGDLANARSCLGAALIQQDVYRFHHLLVATCPIISDAKAAAQLPLDRRAAGIAFRGMALGSVGG